MSREWGKSSEKKQWRRNLLSAKKRKKRKQPNHGRWTLTAISWLPVNVCTFLREYFTLTFTDWLADWLTAWMAVNWPFQRWRTAAEQTQCCPLLFPAFFPFSEHWLWFVVLFTYYVFFVLHQKINLTNLFWYFHFLVSSTVLLLLLLLLLPNYTKPKKMKLLSSRKMEKMCTVTGGSVHLITK